MEFTTQDLYNVIYRRKAKKRGRNDLKWLLGAVIAAIVATAILDTVGMALGLLLAGGIMIGLLKRRTRFEREDRQEATQVYSELPEDLRAEEAGAGE